MSDSRTESAQQKRAASPSLANSSKCARTEEPPASVAATRTGDSPAEDVHAAAAASVAASFPSATASSSHAASAAAASLVRIESGLAADLPVCHLTLLLYYDVESLDGPFDLLPYKMRMGIPAILAAPFSLLQQTKHMGSPLGRFLELVCHTASALDSAASSKAVRFGQQALTELMGYQSQLLDRIERDWIDDTAATQALQAIAAAIPMKPHTKVNSFIEQLIQRAWARGADSTAANSVGRIFSFTLAHAGRFDLLFQYLCRVSPFQHLSVIGDLAHRTTAGQSLRDEINEGDTHFHDDEQSNSEVPNLREAKRQVFAILTILETRWDDEIRPAISTLIQEQLHSSDTGLGCSDVADLCMRYVGTAKEVKTVP